MTGLSRLSRAITTIPKTGALHRTTVTESSRPKYTSSYRDPKDYTNAYAHHLRLVHLEQVVSDLQKKLQTLELASLNGQQ